MESGDTTRDTDDKVHRFIQKLDTVSVDDVLVFERSKTGIDIEKVVARIQL